MQLALSLKGFKTTFKSISFVLNSYISHRITESYQGKFICLYLQSSTQSFWKNTFVWNTQTLTASQKTRRSGWPTRCCLVTTLRDQDLISNIMDDDLTSLQVMDWLNHSLVIEDAIELFIFLVIDSDSHSQEWHEGVLKQKD